MEIDKSLFNKDYADYYEICAKCGVQSCLHSAERLPGNEISRIGRDRIYDGHEFVRSYTVAYTDSIFPKGAK
jgi:hypothetical protein